MHRHVLPWLFGIAACTQDPGAAVESSSSTGGGAATDEFASTSASPSTSTSSSTASEGSSSTDPDGSTGASQGVDSSTGAPIDPADLPPGGYVWLGYWRDTLFLSAHLWTEVQITAGDQLIYDFYGPVSEDDDIAVGPPDSDFTSTPLDAGPSIDAHGREGSWVLEQYDAGGGDYYAEGTLETDFTGAPVGFDFPATDALPAATYPDAIAGPPVELALAQGSATLGQPIDVTWDPVGDGAGIYFYVLGFPGSDDCDECPDFPCEGRLVDDGTFTVPAACTAGAYDSIEFVLEAERFADAEFHGRRLVFVNSFQYSLAVGPNATPMN